jgi:hypothetical protein
VSLLGDSARRSCHQLQHLGGSLAAERADKPSME